MSIGGEKRSDPNQLCDAPGLCRTAARYVRTFGIEDLADVADAAVRQVRIQRGDDPGGLRGIPVHLEPGIHERPDQPRPYRALVIRRVARSQIAVVERLVLGM